MYQIRNFTDNDDIRTLQEMGPFRVIEYTRDLSVAPQNAQEAYFCNEMNIRKRQVICTLGASNITLQAGAMQWMLGDVHATTGIKGVGACNAPQKAASCVKWGIVIAVLTVISIVLGLVGGGEFSITNLVLNLLLPGLYVYVALQVKAGANV